jgi:pyrrolidone-carboxylate peptidase
MPMLPTAQGVELFLEHHSIPVVAFVDRMAFAVRNDLNLPDNRCFVVVDARVHREHEEAAFGQLPSRAVSEIVVDAMDQQDRHTPHALLRADGTALC